MNAFTIHTADTAPAESRPALEQLQERVGFIPNLAATIAESPVAMAGFGAMQGSLRRSKLTALEREVVGITVSHRNRAGYSVAAHCTFAKAAGAGDDVLEALRADHDIADPKLSALQRFTRALLEDDGHLTDDQRTAFAAAGYSNEQALEVITQVAYTTFANHAANLGRTPVDEPFQPMARAVAAA